ncbi:hypothetical protein HYV74_02095 [Candidatus Uhrbacteria bacterium]|nr:hypothetical protein [Candidatus Uhrbacteria bacterium]
MRTTLIAVFVTAILAGGGAFYGGMRYERAQSPAPTERDARMNNNESGRRMFGGGFAGGGSRGNGGNGGSDVVAGEILVMDDTHLTVKLRDGGSRIVFLPATTPITKTAAGSTKDLTQGITIFASGTANPDGSFVAQSIQIRPAARAGAPTP